MVTLRNFKGGLFLDKLTNRNRIAASVAYVTKRTYASASDRWACPACPLASFFQKTKPCKIRSAQFSYMLSVHALR